MLQQPKKKGSSKTDCSSCLIRLELYCKRSSLTFLLNGVLYKENEFKMLTSY